MFAPSREMKRHFLCLKKGKVVDIQTSEGFDSMQQWWTKLSLTDLEQRAEETPLNMIYINASDPVTLADLQNDIQKKKDRKMLTCLS